MAASPLRPRLLRRGCHSLSLPNWLVARSRPEVARHPLAGRLPNWPRPQSPRADQPVTGLSPEAPGGSSRWRVAPAARRLGGPPRARGRHGSSRSVRPWLRL